MDGDLRQSDGAGVGEDAEVDHDVGEVEPDQEPEDMWHKEVEQNNQMKLSNLKNLSPSHVLSIQTDMKSGGSVNMSTETSRL